MMKVLLFLALVAIVSATLLTEEMPSFKPHSNKHHIYRSCGESLTRRVAFLCNGGIIRPEILNALDCCSVGCTDRQLFSWCDY